MSGGSGFKDGNILEFTGLKDRADDPVHTFFRRHEKRVSLACRSCMTPELLFLDEPTAAIDPVLRKKFWEMFRHLADAGRLNHQHSPDGRGASLRHAGLLSDGQVMLSAPPATILEKGRTEINIGLKQKSINKVIDNNPESLAEALRDTGSRKT